MKTEDYVDRQKFKRRHEDFQFGQNPMEMSEFEKNKVHLEQKERKDLREKYTSGIQGKDGGCFPGEHIES